MVEGLLVAGIVTVLMLAAYAGWLVWGLRRIRKRRAETDSSTRETAIASIRVLAREMIEGRLNLTEGSIRIKVMLDYLFTCGEVPDAFQVFYVMHDQTQHMPRRLARNDVPKDQLKQLDKERRKLEFQNAQTILKAAETARDYAF